jgi:large subunit ribosomal protein L32
MAVPKKKMSKSKTRMRRSHDHLTVGSHSDCPKCGQPKQPHRICMSCGHYRGRQVIKIESEDEV